MIKIDPRGSIFMPINNWLSFSLINLKEFCFLGFYLIKLPDGSFIFY